MSRAPSSTRRRALLAALGWVLIGFAGLVGCKRREAGAGASAPAACLANTACASTSFCAFSPGLCGRGPVPGTCQPRPASCGGAYAPVCGCDGTVHDSECAAHAAGVDLAVYGGCKTFVPDWAPCGPRFCDARTTYCEIYLSDVFEIPTTYTCRPLPAACRPREAGARPACDCFPADTPCLSFCGPLPTGGLTAFHLTCQGKKEPRR